MRLPSVKTLREVFAEKATEARRILEMSREELESLPAGAARVRECFHAPETWDVRMHCLDALGMSYGLECLETRRGPCEYLNTGDTYSATLVYFQGKYRVTCWGDIAERFA